MPPTTHIIEIECNNGAFTYHVTSPRIIDGDTPWVYHGDSILWKCTDPSLHFSLYFGWHSPFKACQYAGEPGNELKIEIEMEAQPGTYKYTVAVFNGSKIWIDDPQFIIRG